MEAVKHSSEIAAQYLAAQYEDEIDATLAVLGSVQPRAGLEQRVMARLETVPRLPWYRVLRLAPAGRHRWMIATASGVIVAGAVTISTIHSHRAANQSPIVITQRSRTAQQLIGAAAATSEHPLQPNAARTRHHRGIHRGTRATHERVPLPRGSVAPSRPVAVPNAQ
jgi:hypothetical protein